MTRQEIAQLGRRLPGVQRQYLGCMGKIDNGIVTVQVGLAWDTFCRARQEAGLMLHEGQHYLGLVRHLTLAWIVLGFVAVHTQRLWGENSRGDGGASVPGALCPLCGSVASSARHPGRGAIQPCELL